MKRTNLKNKLSLVLCTMLIVAMAFFTTGCGDNSEKEQSNGNSQVVENNVEKKVFEDGDVIGEGATEFKLVVTNEEDTKTFTVKTDEKTVGAALVANGVVEGTEGEYGLYVDTVNGVKADYDKDKTYWAFYINGEYASTGVDSTDIEAGAEYELKIEK